MPGIGGGGGGGEGVGELKEITETIPALPCQTTKVDTQCYTFRQRKAEKNEASD